MVSLRSGCRVVVVGILMLAAPTVTSVGSAQAKPSESTQRESGVEAVSPASIVGRWYSFFGFMDLEQDGETFSGTYSCCDGVIKGTVNGTDVGFTWKDPIYGEGWGSFQLRKGNSMLVGVWGKEEDFASRGTWNGSRIEEPVIKGTISKFTVTTEHPAFGAFEGSAVIGIDGDTVVGKLEGFFKTPAKEGLFYRDEVFFPLEGKLQEGRLVLEWEDPRNDELGGLELDWGEAVLTGEWEAHRTDRRVAMQ